MSSAEVEQVIIGTAGHIDHGKTALVRALTGFDTDTLAEEKRRGITIELGFAFMDISEQGKEVVFIDVPGHEKLIKTMVAGASNIDAALLVVAADEGINVQTIEHLDILRLLGIKTGLVAITKSDLVDNTHIEAVKAEVTNLTAGTFLEGAPIIPVSAITGAGLDELRSALFGITSKVKARRDSGVFRMPIDRVFTMQGFGVVIAGTILSGEIKVGDKLEILPEKIIARVRGLQVHGRKVDSSCIGRRTAINLQDVKKEQLRRGQCACAPGSIIPTDRLDAGLRTLTSGNVEIKNRERVRLHIGTDEVICRAVLINSNKLSPGQEGLVQMVLESPTTAMPKDPFVLRTFSSMVTIGGGTVLDPHPRPHKRFDDAVIEAAARLEGRLPIAVEQAFIKSRAVPHTPAEIASVIGEDESEVTTAVEELLDADKLVRMTREPSPTQPLKYLHVEQYNGITEKLLGIMNDFFSKNPYRLLMPSADLQSKAARLAERRTIEVIINDLIERGTIKKRGSKFAIAGREPDYKPGEQQLAEQIEEIYRNAGYTSPLEEDVIQDLKIRPDMFSNIMIGLIDQGRLVRLNDKVTYHIESYKKARKVVMDYIESNGSITAAELRDKLDVTRKYAIAILEYFDSTALTKRDGDKRVLRQHNKEESSR